MKGWKTYTGAAIVALGSILPLFGVDESICDAIKTIGGALATVGVGHKLDKASA